MMNLDGKVVSYMVYNEFNSLFFRRDMHFPKVCVCDLCNAEFKSEEYVTRHKLYKHGIGASPYAPAPQPPPDPGRHRSTCEFCGESFWIDRN